MKFCNDKKFKGTYEEYLEFRKRRNEANRKYYSKQEVKEKKRKYKKEYDIKNKERISEYGYKIRATKEYQDRHKRWREENKERLKKNSKIWREENKEHKHKMDREYQKRITRDPVLRKKRLEYQKMIREKNKNKIKKYNKKYNSSPKGKLNWTKQNHLRMSKKHGNKFKLTQEEIQKIYERDKVCVYCGRSKNLELDHIIPVSKGGSSVYNNFVVACRKCNPSKGNKNVIEWCKLCDIPVPKIIYKLVPGISEREALYS